jgi:hypothetical protein
VIYGRRRGSGGPLFRLKARLWLLIEGIAAMESHSTVVLCQAVQHGQMLVSLQMNVQLQNPRFLHSVVKDDEPEGVNEVLPVGKGWVLFKVRANEIVRE